MAQVTCQITKCTHLVKSGTTDSSACTCMSSYIVHVIYHVSDSLFTQVYENVDLAPASWAALVAQLVRASLQSVMGSNPTCGNSFSFFHSP